MTRRRLTNKNRTATVREPAVLLRDKKHATPKRRGSSGAVFSPAREARQRRCKAPRFLVRLIGPEKAEGLFNDGVIQSGHD